MREKKRDGRAVKKNIWCVCTILGVVYLHLLWDILMVSIYFEYTEMGRRLVKINFKFTLNLADKNCGLVEPISLLVHAKRHLKEVLITASLTKVYLERF